MLEHSKPAMFDLYITLVTVYAYYFVLLMQKSQNVRFIGKHILFGAFMAEDSCHGVIFPALSGCCNARVLYQIYPSGRSRTNP